MFSLACNLNQKRCRISARRNFVQRSACKQRGFSDHHYIEKSKWKQRGYFNQRNYIEKSVCKQRGFFDHRNYAEKSTWKRGGFLDHWNNIKFFDRRNYVEKVRKSLSKLFSLTYRRNIHVESTSIRRGVLVETDGNLVRKRVLKRIWCCSFHG